MRSTVGPRRRWTWAIRLLAMAVLAQACGSGSKTTGATGPTQVHLNLTGLETAQLAQNCTGVLTVTGAGMSPISASIPPNGVVSILISPGSRTFTVQLTCVKADGTRTFTGQQAADVSAGQAVNLTIRVVVNEPPRVSASCSPSSVNVGVPSNCSCSASDPDPGDSLSFSWSSTGGSLSSPRSSSTQLQSSSGGTFDVTCEVSDGKATATATTQVTVGGGAAPPPPPGTFTLTGTSIGRGVVISLSPAPIEGLNACGVVPSGTPCSVTYPAGTVVTITATPDAPGTVFSGWGGDCASRGTNPTCTLTMNANHSFTSTSGTANFTLTVTTAGTGSGTVTSSPAGINCPATCAATFAEGTVVTLTASPGASSLFTGWGGACGGTGTCTVTMTLNTSVSATFAAAAVLTVTISEQLPPFGSSVVSSPTGLSCTSSGTTTTCTALFAVGTVVTLTKTEGIGSSFANWGGACPVSQLFQPQCTVTITGPTTVTISFI